MQPFPADTLRRLSLSLTSAELGGGNADAVSEAFYLIVPDATSETPAPSPTPAPARARLVLHGRERPRPWSPPARADAARRRRDSRPACSASRARRSRSRPPTRAGQHERRARVERERPPAAAPRRAERRHGLGLRRGRGPLLRLRPARSTSSCRPACQHDRPRRCPSSSTTTARSSARRSLLTAAQPDIFTSTNGRGRARRRAQRDEPVHRAAGRTVHRDDDAARSAAATAPRRRPRRWPTQLLIMLTGVRGSPRRTPTVRTARSDIGATT